MLKKVIFVFIIFSFLMMSFFVYHLQPSREDLSLTRCPFCDEAVLNRQKFYEDDLIIALYTHRPIYPGHCLIIPKRHVERYELLSQSEATCMHDVIKRVHHAVMETFGTSSYLLLQKNGIEVGQTVPHVHFHYIPRQTGDHSTLGFFVRMTLANAWKPIDSTEMDEIVQKLKTAIAVQDF